MHTGQIRTIIDLKRHDTPASDELVGEFRHFRSLFISDAHLGSRGCKDAELVGLLSNCSADNIYLPGDFLDLMQYRIRHLHQIGNMFPRPNYMPFRQQSVDVIQKLLKHGRAGTNVWYIPGNHDDLIRTYVSKPGDFSEAQIDAHLAFQRSADELIQNYVKALVANPSNQTHAQADYKVAAGRLIHKYLSETGQYTQRHIEAQMEYFNLADDAIQSCFEGSRQFTEKQVMGHLEWFLASKQVADRRTFLSSALDTTFFEVETIFEQLRGIGKIVFLDQAIHPTVGGQRAMIIHGDEFDPLIRGSYVFNMLGPKATTFICRQLDRQGTNVRELMFSVSEWLSHNVASNFSLAERAANFKSMGDMVLPRFASSFLDTVNDAIIDKRDVQGWRNEPMRRAVVCGHNHIPAIIEIAPREKGREPTYYMNCGDWIKSCTALAEDFDGRFHLVQWKNGEGIVPFVQNRKAIPQSLLPGRYVESVYL